MKVRNIQILVALLAATVAPAASAQSTDLEFVDPSDAPVVEADVYWGNISVVGEDRTDVQLVASYTGPDNRRRTLSDPDEYATVRRVGGIIGVRARRPGDGVFESVDLQLRVPSHARVLLRVEKGGEISVKNMADLVEVNHRNGSVSLEGLRGPAVVNATNGSISASFDEVDHKSSMSFITLNGGIDLAFPADYAANVRFRSEQNGYVFSEFGLPDTAYPYSQEPGSEAAERRYSKQPISIVSEIGGGGPWLVATTENGPIRVTRR